MREWIKEYGYLILAAVLILVLVVAVISLIVAPGISELILGIVIGFALPSLSGFVNHLLDLHKETRQRERETRLEEKQDRMQRRQELRTIYENAMSSLGYFVTFAEGEAESGMCQQV